eukprot:COSAG02_NODE_5564_length_4225_cov_7.667071_3_plen_66_part_00
MTLTLGALGVARNYSSVQPSRLIAEVARDANDTMHKALASMPGDINSRCHVNSIRCLQYASYPYW